MSRSPRDLIMEALRQYKGDNAARARAAWHGLSQEQMQQVYGVSGRTRAEILAEYEAHEAEVVRAVVWLDMVS